MADLYEVLLTDGGRRWHAGFLVDDETETDVLLMDGERTLLFADREALEAAATTRGLELEDDLPDEVDLDLGGWLTGDGPQPSLDEVSELWHLLVDHPAASRALTGEVVEEAYDDLVEEQSGTGEAWFAEHGGRARTALRTAVERLRATLHRA